MITLTGSDSEQTKKRKLQLTNEGNFQVLIATGQLIGEGTDIGLLNCLVLAYPFSFEGKLIQYIGRVQRSALAPVIYDYRDYRIPYLDNQFKERNKYYRKLMKSGSLASMEELVLIFQGSGFYINTTGHILPIACLDLPLPVETFREDVIWKIRVNKYDEEEGLLLAEIIDYHYSSDKIKEAAQSSFYYHGIEKIVFRSIDTSGLLSAVILERSADQTPKQKPIVHDIAQETVFEEYLVLKEMKLPFAKINFLNGAVSFELYVDEIGYNLEFEIANADIRPEFAAIRDYFAKALKKKLVQVTINARYTEEKVLSAIATSEDINSINQQMIDTVRFEFVKKAFFKGRQEAGLKPFQTMDQLLSPHNDARSLFTSETALLNDILDIKKSKHYSQLKYLSGKHEAGILKLRFVLQPFSFLFLLAGTLQYYIIWETLDTEDATYAWSTDQSRAALQTLLSKIEVALAAIKHSGRQAYLETHPVNFTRFVHDYSDAQKGFVVWKGMLEEGMW